MAAKNLVSNCSYLGHIGPNSRNKEKMRAPRAERSIGSCRKRDANIIPGIFRSNATVVLI